MPMMHHGKEDLKNLNQNQKKNINFKFIMKIFSFGKEHSFSIFLSVIFAILGNLAIIIGPEKIQEIVQEISNGILGNMDIVAITNMAIVLVCIYLFGACCSYFQQYITAIVTQKISKKMRSQLDEKFNNLPLGFYDKNSRGDLLSRVTNDVDVVSQTLGSSVANLISSIVLFVGLIFQMFKSNYILAIVTILTSVLGFIMMAVIVKISQKYFYKRQQLVGKINSQIEEDYTNLLVVKSYNASNNEKEKFAKTANDLYGADWKSQWLSGFMPAIMTFVGNLAYLLIFVVGTAIALNWYENPLEMFGTIISFIIYAKLFSQPLQTLSQSMQTLQQASASSSRVFEILDEKEMPQEDDLLDGIKKVKGNINFKKVRFGYNKNKPIIKDFSLNVKSGQKIAIVGPTGAGKTTIVNLLMKFYDIDEGTITIDGVRIQDLKREAVHDLFDMILQDTWLFEGTIRENLVYNKKGVTDEQLNKVCEAVGLTHYIKTLPDGYDTKIKSSAELSEGQKQQLTIARAMIKNSPLLILDEATSNVDTRTELIIQNAMDKLTEGRTSFVIAHRLSTIRNADKILVINDGNIVEQGTHNELLEKNGFYAQLYNSQFATCN